MFRIPSGPACGETVPLGLAPSARPRAPAAGAKTAMRALAASLLLLWTVPAKANAPAADTAVKKAAESVKAVSAKVVISARAAMAAKAPSSLAAVTAASGPDLRVSTGPDGGVPNASTAARYRDRTMWLALLGCAVFAGSQMTRRRMIRNVLS